MDSRWKKSRPSPPSTSERAHLYQRVLRETEQVFRPTLDGAEDCQQDREVGSRSQHSTSPGSPCVLAARGPRGCLNLCFTGYEDLWIITLSREYERGGDVGRVEAVAAAPAAGGRPRSEGSVGLRLRGARHIGNGDHEGSGGGSFSKPSTDPQEEAQADRAGRGGRQEGPRRWQ